ncbi:lauroyl-Kdo(2)-lipid IV(A) myristoyltransferase [Ferrimonas senticii]|uniref:lauroyl-Kdo(2)-lipid IV(A) myristoyltransferase n=1 Tax=Ferrimonas senticii TaxID=394566 RepID=UPI0006859B90|nr:lauroyl-Kdo(2)-lipid IV(A) myristoyltransferase [Ferrimonas senticii]
MTSATAVLPTPANRYQVRFSAKLLLPQYWPAWLLVALLALLAWLPLAVRVALARALQPLIRPFCRKPERIARRNLQLCFPKQTIAEQQQQIERLRFTFTLTALSIGTLTFQSRQRLQSRMRLQGLEHLQQARKQGRPVVFLLPHMFALEYAAAALAMTGLPMVGFVKHHRNPVFNWLSCRQRLRFGGHLFHRDGGIRAVIAALRQGHSLFYLPDQDHGANHSQFASFFATQKATLPVLGRIARSSGALVLPLSCGFCHQTGLLDMQLQAPLQLEQLSKPQEAHLLNQQLEQLIAAYPSQYMWFLKILKSRPDGSQLNYRPDPAATTAVQSN